MRFRDRVDAGHRLAAVVQGAALGPDVGRFLFQAVGHALSWLFTGTIRFLP